MKNSIKLRIMILFSCAFLSAVLSASDVRAMNILQPGARGSRVREVQEYLYQLNYMRIKPTGYYGVLTMEAVKSFQIEHNLTIDGLVGPETMNALQRAISQRNKLVKYTVKPGETLENIAARFGTDAAVIMARNNLPGKQVFAGQILLIPAGDQLVSVNSRNRAGGVQAVPWSIVNQLWRNGEVVRIIDAETGKSFQAKRLYGYYHADAEPLTKMDTKVMKEIFGGQWSWERRGVVVQVRNLYIAASINGMPHGGESIYDNDFQGQFCVHFLGSRIHQTGRVDRQHHEMIERASGSPLILGDLLTQEAAPPIAEPGEK